MAKWTSTSDYPNLASPDDADLLPIADVSEASGSQQRTITWSQLTSLQASELGDLSDVDTYGASDGDVLVYDSGSGEWLPEAPAGDVSGPAGATDERVAVFDGATGKLLKEASVTVAGLATSAQGDLADSAVQPGDPISINAQTGTTYTLVLGDAGKLVTLDNGSAITLTVPLNSSVAFPVGTVVECAQLGAGLVTTVGATGVTVNGATPGSNASAGQWSAWRLVKLATDTWLASGDLA